MVKLTFPFTPHSLIKPGSKDLESFNSYICQYQILNHFFIVFFSRCRLRFWELLFISSDKQNVIHVFGAIVKSPKQSRVIIGLGITSMGQSLFACMDKITFIWTIRGHNLMHNDTKRKNSYSLGMGISKVDKIYYHFLFQKR